MGFSAEFIVTVAEALVMGVAAKTDEMVEGLRRNPETVVLTVVPGPLEALKKDLEVAIRLADGVAGAKKEKALGIRAAAFFQLGLVELIRHNPRGAVEHLKKALQNIPNAATYYMLGLCYLRMRTWWEDHAGEAVDAFTTCIELEPTSDIAIAAGKQLARLGKL